MITVSKILQKEIGKPPKKIHLLTGGDINQVYHCVFEDQNLVVKLNSANSFAEMFEKEKKGLELLTTSTFQIPNPIAVGTFENYDYLILEYIHPGNSINWEIFGEKLAHLHNLTNPKFGLDYDNYIGSLLQKNSYENSWEEFYTNHRILYLTSIARNKELLNNVDCAEIEKICSKLEDILPKTDPSLIHGDLWSGNLISDKNNYPVLIDPAVYYGHPEMDWAMLSLFGNYPTIAIDKYNDINTMEKGFEKRKEIHQLYPILVHLILFGSGYYGSLKDILKKFI